MFESVRGSCTRESGRGSCLHLITRIGEQVEPGLRATPDKPQGSGWVPERRGCFPRVSIRAPTPSGVGREEGGPWARDLIHDDEMLSNLGSDPRDWMAAAFSLFVRCSSLMLCVVTRGGAG